MINLSFCGNLSRRQGKAGRKNAIIAIYIYAETSFPIRQSCYVCWAMAPCADCRGTS